MPTLTLTRERKTKSSATVVSADNLMRVPYRHSPSWKKTAGLLRRQRAELMRHLRRVRSEWEAHPAD